MYIRLFITFPIWIVIGWMADMVYVVDVESSWLIMWSSFMLVIATIFLVIVTALMVYYLRKTVQHAVGSDTATIFDKHIDKIMNNHEHMLTLISMNCYKPDDQKENYLKYIHNDRYELANFLRDLEYIGILYSNKIIKFDILFNVFAPILIMMKKDKQITDYIDERCNVSAMKSTKPYAQLVKLMNECHDYDLKKSKIDVN